MSSIKFGICIKHINGEYKTCHYEMSTNNNKAASALKKFSCYVISEKQHWICPGKDFYLSDPINAEFIYQIIDLVEVPPVNGDSVRMQFWDDTYHLHRM